MTFAVQDMGTVNQAKLAELVQTMVAASIAGAQQVRFEAGTYEGVTVSGDGIVRLDSADPVNPEVAYGTIVGPQPNRGGRVIFAHIPPMAGYILGEVMLPAVTGQLQPRVLLDSPNGRIDFYDTQGTLVGRLSSERWWAGVEEGGSRVQLDPLSGLRIYDTEGFLVGIFDGQGIQFRDPDPDRGIVHASINAFGQVLTSDDGKQIHLIPSQSGSLVVPKWAGEVAGPSPGPNVDTPPLVEYTASDLEVRFADVYSDVTLPSTFTPPAGFTEIYDVSDSTNAMTVASSCATRQPASSQTTQTFVCSQSSHVFNNGHSVLVRANDTGPVPSVRSFQQQFSTFTTSTMSVSMPKPFGVAEGDLLIAKVSMGNKGGWVPVSWSVPDGWLFMGAVFRDIGGMSTLASGIWYKRATASEPATYDVSINVAGSPVSQKRFHAAVVCIQNPGSLQGGSDIRFEPQSKCRVWLTPPSTPIPGVGVPWTVPFDAIDYDPGHNFDLANHRYVVPADGPYNVGFGISTGLTAIGEIFRANITRIALGGALTEMSGTGTIASPGICRLTTTDILNLNAGDTLTVDGIQENGPAPRDIQGGNKARFFFYVQRSLSL